LPNIAKVASSVDFSISAMFGNLANFGNVNHPIPKSAEDSNGVPHTRQITAEQSPQIRGSVTSQAHLGQ